ncbi:hypothetical protein [Microbulbifer epialgicus]|uniref:Uncharacterized protein n=1 Tax=Microbulbifer epialgicus TaxID=393907 RepID=A0ABV4NTK9_9GAMM
MDTLKVASAHINPTQGNWRGTFESLTNNLYEIPTVISGSVNIQAAHNWLALVSKIYPEHMCKRMISQASGLGAHDIRTLIAHDRNEYYPTDSAMEIYERKRLTTIVAPNNPNFEKDKILTSIARKYLLDKYGVERNSSIERAMSTTDNNRNVGWLVGQPGMIGSTPNENFLFDIQRDSNVDTVSQSDLIRLHYYDLVGNNLGFSSNHLNLVKMAVDESFLDSLVTLTQISKDCRESISKIGIELENLPESKFKVRVHSIEKQPDLYKEIMSSGKKHWKNIINGNDPEKKIDPPLYLTENRKAVYVEKAKNFVSACQTEKAATDARIDAASDFISSMKGFDISDNFSPPYLGALIRKYDYFDSESAATYMEQNLGVDPAHIRNQQLNIDRLKEEFIRMGGDISRFYETSTPDKASIETCAEQIGLDLSSFYLRKMKAIVNPKTRGPIFDAIMQVRNSVSCKVTELNNEISHSPLMDNKNLVADVSTSRTTQQKIKI